ncbi:MAG: hypothetical protein K2M89_02045 [Clostridiales bacterium]|nr:hypothetical protein [Clostridiales bacterium]
MLTNQNELFLSEYFFTRSALGKLIKDPRRVFDVLAQIYLIPDADVDGLYALAEDKLVADVTNYADYLQFCRIKKYVALIGGESEFPDEIEDVIAVKGEALARAYDLKLDGTCLTESAVFRAVTEGAAYGTVAAMRILGFIQCEGIYTDRDLAAGVKNLEKAAGWNSVESMLAVLYFGGDRQSNINRLRTVAEGTVYRAFPALAEAKYGVAASGVVKEGKLLNKAFALGKLTPDTYSAQHARIICSDMLDPRDKERAMFSPNDQAISDVAELPLKLHSVAFALDRTAFDDMPLVRHKEQERIAICLTNSDLLERSAFRPLCVCADSEYLRKLYSRHIRAAFSAAHVEYIDVAGLDENDLQPTGKHIFVRSCDEDLFNVYFMSFVGNISDRVMQEAVEFLQSRRRKKFCLLSPAVVINLCKVLPICFCDKQNAKELKKYCDVVTVGAVSATEKPAAYADMVASKQRLYGAKNVMLSDAAVSRLNELSVDGAESVIDSVIKYNRTKAETVITPALIDECSATRAEKHRYGFGGDGDEI